MHYEQKSVVLWPSPHKLKTDAKMVPEVEVVQHMNHVVGLILILQPEMVQHPHFHQRLVMEPLLIPDDLDCDLSPCAMILSPDDLAEGSLANHFEDLISVGYVVVDLLKKEKDMD